jgi:hypothetical protein
MSDTQQGLQKDPQDWKSGDDPATPAQESYLHTLAEQSGEDIPAGMTKAAASEKIDELRAKAGLDDKGNAGADIGFGIGDPVPTDEEVAGQGDDTVRATPISPNANR